jgi:hypothetical protein
MNDAPTDAPASLALRALAVAIALAGAPACASAPIPSRAALPASHDGEARAAVRVEAGAVWAGARPFTAQARAWSVPGRGPVDALEVRPLAAGDGFVVTFRQDGRTWRGELDADRRARTPLCLTSGDDRDGRALDALLAPIP